MRVELHKENKDIPRVKLLPAALVGTFVAATEGKFNLGKTLSSGTPVFLRDTVILLPGNFQRAGYTYLNSIALFLPESHPLFYSAFAHEYIHTLQ